MSGGGKGKRGGGGGGGGSNKMKESSIPPLITIPTLVQELTNKNKDINRSAFLGFLQTLIGAEVEVNLVDGTAYRAIYYTSTPFQGKKYEIVFKNARKLDETTEMGTTLIFQFEQIKYITALKSKFVSTSAAQSKELETDAMLSRKTNIAELDGRDLQSIDSSWLTPETTAQLDSRHSIGAWNQFEANKRLYNYQDTYDENLYTKRLDRSQLTREQLERAHHLAIAIESSTTTNFHLREERGQISTGEEENYDEEDRYSGVLRQNSPGGTAKGGSKAKNSPTGSWKRVSLPSQQTPASSSPTSWGSKPVSYAAVAYKNTQSGQKSVKSDPTLPPGFGTAPTEGGYFKSNIDSSNIEPNISFYGTSDAPLAESAPEALSEPVPEATVTEAASPAQDPEQSSTTETLPAKTSPLEVATVEPELVSKAPEGTLSPSDLAKPDTPSDTSSVTSLSTASTTPVTSKLRAAAVEWKPGGVTSPAANPSPVTTTSTNTGFNNNRKSNKNRPYKNNNYHNAGYDQSNMYQQNYTYDQNQMYQQPFQDMSGAFMGMPMDPNIYFPPPLYPPAFDPNAYPAMSMPMYMVVPPEMMMMPPPQGPFFPGMEYVVGMENGNSGVVAVAPGLGDVGNHDSHNNEGN